MTAQKTRKIEQSLTSKGFVLDDTHHRYFHLEINGEKQHIFTYFSHGQNELGAKLLAMMAKQLKLKKKELDDLINCPLSKEDYIQILRKNQEL